MVLVRNNRRISILLLIVVGFIFIVSFALTYPAIAAALLWINPVSVDIEPGGSAHVVLQLSDSTNVYGALISLDFDPSLIAVVDSDPGTSGVQISAGTCPKPDFIVTNIADNLAGTIDYTVSQLMPSPPCDGGVVASVEFQCITPDTSIDVSFIKSIISDPDGVLIVHSTQDGTVNCLEEPSYKIYLPLTLKD